MAKLYFYQNYLLMKKIALLIFGIFLFFTDASATHMLGGEIMWECHPTTGKYKFIVKLYRECGGSTASLPTSVSLSGSPITISCNIMQQLEISPNCANSTYLSCQTSNAGQGAVVMGVYESTWVTLNGVPPPIGWGFNWGTCCRPVNISNVATSSFQIRATMYSFNNLNANSCYDNSPKFLMNPLIVACNDMQTTYNHMGFDADLDSLYYSFATAKSSSSTNVVYSSGYSATNPLPDGSFNINNQAAVLEGASGQLTFKSKTNGEFVTVIKMEEWRQGVLLGEVYREFPIIVRNCTYFLGVCPQYTNDAPMIVLSVDSLKYPNGPFVNAVLDVNGDTAYYESYIDAGDEINLIIASYDMGFTELCLPQMIYFNAFGGSLANDSIYADSTLCDYSAPCATLKSLNNLGGFTNTTPNRIGFHWKTDAPNLNYQQFTSQPYYSTHTFYFKAKDNLCKMPGEGFMAYKVKMAIKLPVPPTLENTCVDLVASSGDLSFNWTTKTDTLNSFNYYIVYHAINKNGPYAAIDSVFNFSDTTFTDYARGNGTNYYFLRTASRNQLLSKTSDTISLIHLLITPVPYNNPDTALLDWTAYSTNPNPGVYYQISKKILPNGNWNIIDTTLGLTYSDPLGTTSFSNVDYKISINGKCFSAKAQGIGLNENILSAVKVSPNPFSEKILVSLPTEINAKALTLKLFGIDGKELKSIEISIRDSEIEINNVASLPRGVYFLQLSVNGKVKTFKLLH